jgi:hypothetical protein
MQDGNIIALDEVKARWVLSECACKLKERHVLAYAAYL